MAESVDGGTRGVKKGKLERVPHLHFKLGGRLFAALYSAGLVLIPSDRRRAASVPVSLRHHVKSVLEKIAMLLFWVGRHAVSCFRSKVRE